MHFFTLNGFKGLDMKRILATALVGTALAFSTPALAESDVKIGVIDLGAVMERAPEAQKVRDQLKAEFDPKQEEIMTLQKSVKDQEERLTRDGAVMTAADKTKLTDKIDADKRQLQRLQEAFMQDIRLAQSKSMQGLLETLNKAVEKIAKDQSMDIIFQKDQLVFASNKVDMTETVIAALAGQTDKKAQAPAAKKQA